jgi:hypothetical protein
MAPACGSAGHERRRFPAKISREVSIWHPLERRQDTTTPQEEPMRYLLLICNDETAVQALSPDEQAAEMGGYAAFGAEMGARGVLKDGNRLRPTTDATTVQVRNGEVLTADGPFAETKEQMGGYYVVECADLDEAIEVASKVPAAGTGTIEIRPIWDM